MIIRCIQTSRQPKPAYSFKNENVKICSAVGATRHSPAKIEFSQKSYSLAKDIYKEKDTRGLALTGITDVIHEGRVIGRIYAGTIPLKKILFMTIGYDYFGIDFFDQKLKGYEIGLGENQHYISIYEKERTIAIIHKDDKIIDYKDTYTIYLEDESYLEAVCLFTVSFDCARYPDIGEVSGKNIDNDVYISIQKELNEKYDPTFIPRIRAMHVQNNVDCSTRS